MPLHSRNNGGLSTPLLSSSTPSSSNSSDTDESPAPLSRRYNNDFPDLHFTIPKPPISSSFQSYKSLAVLSGHIGSVSSLALCGEFILSASQGRDIIVWQHPDLRQFTKFGQGSGSVKALLAVGNRVFTAHQDTRIRAWKVSRSSENVFRIINTLPTTKDCLGKLMRQSNYVQTRRNHKKLWIQHADSISCLAFHNGYIYSGSWDKTLKVWRLSDFKCVESIKAHDDAINALISSNGAVYSASADGRIKAWRRTEGNSISTHSLVEILEGHKDVSFNTVVACEDGRFLYGGGSDGYVMGWGWGGRKVCEVKAHEMAVLCMCIMGDFVCSGSGDKSIGIWRREMNGGIFRVGVIKGHEGPIRCLQASPLSVGGGFMLYSGSLDRSLRVWWVPKYCDTAKSEEKSVFLRLPSA
ncbi:PREDICTED: uncharacterized protein LOC109151935 [Ipomoea nil]|uniref:uncharacterized protein LOC109151935 n=1 Tax=Ipomoea nil TaxID=35883 RepID=UPI000900C9AB|nr:PREDICTED: uncharacterized protein LOC109151935 [Ipomoea nil]